MVDGDAEGGVTLRPMEYADLPFLIDVRNECREFLHDDRAFTLDECRRWFLQSRPDFWVIMSRGQRVGYVRLSRHDTLHASIYVGADLHKQFRGRGFAKAAYAELFSFLLQQRGIRCVLLEVLSHNVRALRLYEVLGFVEIGRRKQYCLRDDVPVDSIVMRKVLAVDAR